MIAPHALFRPTLVGLAVVTLAAFSAPAAPVAPRMEVLRRHARLVKSSPGADVTLTAAPTSVKLWFSERVEVSLSRVQLIGPGGTVVASGRASRIPGENELAFMAAVRTPLSAGRHTVRWTTASDDGHPIKGTFSFVVAPRQ
jgi:methionine-rich copper-binding protein CopC